MKVDVLTGEVDVENRATREREEKSETLIPREEDAILKILREYRNLAVIGISRQEHKDAFRVPEYMQRHGYSIIPVNPFSDEIMGARCYPDLEAIPMEIMRKIEVVVLFRPSDEILDLVRRIIEIRRRTGRPNVIWMQLGIVNESAAEMARKAGMKVVMDRCLLIEHERLLRK